MSKIEIEERFKPTPSQQEALLEGTFYLGQQNYSDDYYDYPNMFLLKNKIKLRKRNGVLELKIRLADREKLEINNEDEIKKYFLENFNQEFDLAKMINFASYQTERKKYTKEGFLIDVDDVHLKEGVIDRSVDIEQTLGEDCSKEDRKKSKDEIIKFAERHGIPCVRLPSKISEYLKINNPELYREVYCKKVVQEIKMK